MTNILKLHFAVVMQPNKLLIEDDLNIYNNLTNRSLFVDNNLSLRGIRMHLKSEKTEWKILIISEEPAPYLSINAINKPATLCFYQFKNSHSTP